jgi:hypothetical protein
MSSRMPDTKPENTPITTISAHTASATPPMPSSVTLRLCR